MAKPGSAEEAAAIDADAVELARTKAFREKMRAKLAAREAATALEAAGEGEAGAGGREAADALAYEGDEGGGVGGGGGGAEGGAGTFEERMRAKVMAKRRELGDVKEEDAAAAAGFNEKEEKRRHKEEKAADKAKRAAERQEREATRLRKLGIGKAKLSSDDAALLSDKEVRRVELKHKRKLVVGREKDMLAKLATFSTNLKGSLRAAAGADAGAGAGAGAGATKKDSDAAGSGDKGGGGEEGGDAAGGRREGEQRPERDGAIGVSRFVAEGLYYLDDDDEDDRDWKSHALNFVKDGRGGAGAYMPSVDDYVVEDPLNPKP